MNFEEIQDLIIAGWKSQTLFTALELGIFEQLTDEPKTLSDLAEKCQFSADAGKRLLSTCVALGLITKQGLFYQNSSATQQFLVQGKPTYLGKVARHIKDIEPLWNKLTDAVKENSNRWQQVTGSKEGHFSSLYKDPQKLENFLFTMHLYNEGVALAVADNFNFSKHSCLLDVGGATGIFDHIVLTKFPHLKITVFDLPNVCKITDKYIKDKYSQSHRINTQSGNFLEDSLPAGFDIIYLGWVLHDWSPEVQIKILEKCYQALPSGGVLLATECLVNEDETGPLLTTLISLDMLVSTDGGVESTGNEYIERFTKAGFSNVNIQKLPTMRDLIVGIRP